MLGNVPGLSSGRGLGGEFGVVRNFFNVPEFSQVRCSVDVSLPLLVRLEFEEGGCDERAGGAKRRLDGV